MRRRLLGAMAVIGVLCVPAAALAWTPDVTVRLDAIGPVSGGQAAARKPAPKPPGQPARSAFVDTASLWVPDPVSYTIELPDIGGGVLQCVPYARQISGIGLRGDAWTWWDKAAGTYARGSHPEPGAVLAFPGIERMPLGHVAVVTQVLGARKILIDHANWPTALVRHGAISRGMSVLDISPGNDWTLVRVQFGGGGPMGSPYPAHGFIYGWSEAGVPIAKPAFSLDYALWSPVAPSWRMFNPIAFSWALPKSAQPKAYANGGRVPTGVRPVLALGASGTALNGSALGGAPVMAVNRLLMGRLEPERWSGRK